MYTLNQKPVFSRQYCLSKGIPSRPNSVNSTCDVTTSSPRSLCLPGHSTLPVTPRVALVTVIATLFLPPVSCLQLYMTCGFLVPRINHYPPPHPPTVECTVFS